MTGNSDDKEILSAERESRDDYDLTSIISELLRNDMLRYERDIDIEEELQ